MRPNLLFAPDGGCNRRLACGRLSDGTQVERSRHKRCRLTAHPAVAPDLADRYESLGPLRRVSIVLWSDAERFGGSDDFGDQLASRRCAEPGPTLSAGVVLGRASSGAGRGPDQLAEWRG